MCVFPEAGISWSYAVRSLMRGPAALARETKTVRLGTLVTGVTYRNPALLAKTATTLDVISGGRAIFGLGAAWFDAEHVTLRAAQRTAADHGLHRTAWQLAWTLNTFQYRRGHRHDQLAVWQVAVDAAAHLTDPVSHVLAHRLFGRAHAELGRHTREGDEADRGRHRHRMPERPDEPEAADEGEGHGRHHERRFAE